MNAQPMHEEEYERESIFTKAKRLIFGDEEFGEFEQEAAHAQVESAPVVRRHPQIRMQMMPPGKVNVRRNAAVFEDAKAAVDGLINGEQQIINLERASPQMKERIFDFVGGACYALDGTVSQISDKVFMFVPANVTVDSDDSDTGSASTAAGRRSQYGE